MDATNVFVFQQIQKSDLGESFLCVALSLVRFPNWLLIEHENSTTTEIITADFYHNVTAAALLTDWLPLFNWTELTVGSRLLSLAVLCSLTLALLLRRTHYTCYAAAAPYILECRFCSTRTVYSTVLVEYYVLLCRGKYINILYRLFMLIYTMAHSTFIYRSFRRTPSHLVVVVVCSLTNARCKI